MGDGTTANATVKDLAGNSEEGTDKSQERASCQQVPEAAADVTSRSQVGVQPAGDPKGVSVAPESFKVVTKDLTGSPQRKRYSATAEEPMGGSAIPDIVHTKSQPADDGLRASYPAPPKEDILPITHCRSLRATSPAPIASTPLSRSSSGSSLGSKRVKAAGERPSATATAVTPLQLPTGGSLPSPQAHPLKEVDVVPIIQCRTPRTASPKPAAPSPLGLSSSSCDVAATGSSSKRTAATALSVGNSASQQLLRRSIEVRCSMEQQLSGAALSDYSSAPTKPTTAVPALWRSPVTMPAKRPPSSRELSRPERTSPSPSPTLSDTVRTPPFVKSPPSPLAWLPSPCLPILCPVRLRAPTSP